MTVPLIILAVGAAFAGYLNLPGIFGGHQQVTHWLSPSLLESHAGGSHSLELLAIGASIAAFGIGLYIAYKKFYHGAEEPVYTGFAKFGYNLFYVDQMYDALIVKPYHAFGRFIKRTLEPYVTDGHVKVSTALYQMFGSAFKVFQVGYVRVYAIYMIIGLSLMSLFLSQTLN